MSTNVASAAILLTVAVSIDRKVHFEGMAEIVVIVSSNCCSRW